MSNSDLHNIADCLFDCLLLIRRYIFNEHELIKNFPKAPIDAEECFKKFPMPASHIKVILYLKNAKSSPISQIASNLNISKPNMTPIIDKLIEYDLVKKYPDPNDRRIIRIELTDKSNNIFNIFSEYAKDSICDNLTKLSQNDLVLLEESLVNLYSIFTKLDNIK